jgi:succinate dehydrogenase flavin-adding protein (antitoxin of CptAB toxin-antitoxin module)
MALLTRAVCDYANRCQDCINGGEGVRCVFNENIAETQWLPGNPKNCQVCGPGLDATDTASSQKHLDDQCVGWGGIEGPKGAEADCKGSPRPQNVKKKISEMKESQEGDFNEWVDQFAVVLEEGDDDLYELVTKKRPGRPSSRPLRRSIHTILSQSWARSWMCLRMRDSSLTKDGLVGDASMS